MKRHVVGRAHGVKRERMDGGKPGWVRLIREEREKLGVEPAEEVDRLGLRNPVPPAVELGQRDSRAEPAGRDPRGRRRSPPRHARRRARDAGSASRASERRAAAVTPPRCPNAESRHREREKASARRRPPLIGIPTTSSSEQQDHHAMRGRARYATPASRTTSVNQRNARRAPRERRSRRRAMRR